MMNKSAAIADAVKRSRIKVEPSSTLSLMLENKLNSLFFVKSKEDEDRKGLHASAIIDSENNFCYREQVLSLVYKRNKAEKEEMSVSLARIFREGEAIHEKWQRMFKNAGIAVAIEDRGYSKSLDLYMTPDAIVKINGKFYVCEIKSMNTFAFKHLKDTHPKGTKQLQLYMHFTCIPQGFVLCEDKNTQEIKILAYDYDFNVVRPYLERLYKISKYKEKLLSEGKLVKRKCGSLTCKRAQDCPMSDTCFGIRKEKL